MGDTTSTEDSFPTDNFFLNISSLYIDDMDDSMTPLTLMQSLRLHRV
jgi:hypothetical protein